MKSFIILFLCFALVPKAEAASSVVVKFNPKLTIVNSPSHDHAVLFGSRIQPLHLLVYTAPHQQIEIAADLFALTEGLSAPLQKDVLIYRGGTDSEGIEQAIMLDIETPPVKRESSLLLAVRAKTGQEPWSEVARLQLKVYAPTFFDDFKKWAQTKKVILYDPEHILDSFLKEYQIRFVATDSLAPWITDTDGEELVLIASGVPTRDERLGIKISTQRVVIFNSKPGDPLIVERSTGILVKADRDRIQGLKDNPLAQLYLKQVIELALTEFGGNSL